MLIPTVGIVAEYNPLHKGHLYHIGQARAQSGADRAVAVMSGHFVQRGEPALLDKWQRAEMALAAGVNLVLELPAVFAAHNAGVFASAAVKILGASGIVSHISFGVESPDWHMDKVLDILLEESQGFKLSLQNFLKKGYSFVEARSLALEELAPGSAEYLRKSNNMLALSYMLRMREQKLDLRAVPVKRIGAGYHETEAAEFSSATGIRKKLRAGDTSGALELLPAGSAEILARDLDAGRVCLNYDRFWELLRASLLRATAEEVARHAEMGEGIENRLRREALGCGSFEEWASLCTSKRYPRGRIQRHAVHFLLGLGHWENRAFQRLGPAYIRVLGADKTGRKMLGEMRGAARLPVITRCGAARDGYAEKMMRYDLLAAEMWEQLIPSGVFGKERARKVIMK